jgi:hypothetical protein
MTQPLPRDLLQLARDTGYAAIPCPTCVPPGAGRERAGVCANCGGSGRLWTSPRGSLSDDGLKRLRHLLPRRTGEWHS